MDKSKGRVPTMSNRFVVSDRRVALGTTKRGRTNTVDFVSLVVIVFAAAFIAGRLFF
jgi:hypothetical protein